MENFLIARLVPACVLPLAHLASFLSVGTLHIDPARWHPVQTQPETWPSLPQWGSACIQKSVCHLRHRYVRLTIYYSKSTVVTWGLIQEPVVRTLLLFSHMYKRFDIICDTFSYFQFSLRFKRNSRVVQTCHTCHEQINWLPSLGERLENYCIVSSSESIWSISTVKHWSYINIDFFLIKRKYKTNLCYMNILFTVLSTSWLPV